VVVGGSDLVDLDDVSVARTTIPHAGGVGFRSLAPTEGEGATPVRRPGAVIVTHDGLGFVVAECDEVGGHSGIPFDRGGVSIRHTEPCGGALLIIHFWALRSASKQESKRALTTGHSTYAQEATQMPRRRRSSTEVVSNPSGRGTWRGLPCPASRLD
jgi:hypothetical protein